MKTQSEITKNKKFWKLAAQSFFFGAVVVCAEASSQTCNSSLVKSSVYFVPHVKDYCSTPTPCAAFKKEVKMQGSGTLPGNKLLTYSGKIRDLGDCDTAFGASGKCLIPFISVAADPKHYRMGDVIQMSSMRGKEITLPNGKTMIHPGYFIVHDTGGAIKGKNRFDFFTGSFKFTDPENVFGSMGGSDTQMSDISDCSSRKSFTVVRRSYDGYDMALAKIEDAVSGSSVSSIIASGSGQTSSSSGVR